MELFLGSLKEVNQQEGIFVSLPLQCLLVSSRLTDWVKQMYSRV